MSFNGATPNQALTFNFGSPIAGGGTGTDGITQYGSPDTISTQSQDGYASGSLTGVTIDANGTVQGSYTNGQTLAVAQMGIAKFPSNTGLGQMGQNLWNATRIQAFRRWAPRAREVADRSSPDRSRDRTSTCPLSSSTSSHNKADSRPIPRRSRPPTKCSRP